MMHEASFHPRGEASRRYQASREAELSEPPHPPIGFREVLASLSPVQWISGTGVAGFLMALIIFGIMAL
jgi:hypothetical protein